MCPSDLNWSFCLPAVSGFQGSAASRLGVTRKEILYPLPTFPSRTFFEIRKTLSGAPSRASGGAPSPPSRDVRALLKRSFDIVLRNQFDCKKYSFSFL